MANILITAPWLDENKTVSGVSTVVRTIMENNDSQHVYHHFRMGKSDGQKKNLTWFIEQFLLYPKLFLVLLNRRISILHLNTAFEKNALIRDYFAYIIAKKILKKTIFLHIHGGYYLMQPLQRDTFLYNVAKKMLHGSDLRFVLSPIEDNKINEDYDIRCTILPNAIPSPATIDRKNFESKLKLIYLGRLVRSKGIFVLLEALAELGPEIDNFEFNIYGAGADKEEFLEKIKDVKDLNYKYRGVIKGQDKLDVLKQSHIFLLPSLSSEGLPMALLEAMSYGCVVLVSDDASMTSVVKDSYNGFIFPRGDKKALINKLKEIFSHRNSLSEIGASASKTVYSNFNIRSYMTALNEWVDKALAPNTLK
ncbi:Glycosyltransferase involved in cell wall bisynthesis [Mucilaginibacter pineti]|uniref:Glycosyltransferase involved in cell wall bisynthesis n=1 Tax=Mucilaginibacter pineti TaxID=1391627 RepID=A0A1G6ZFL3_9SPHI|nr:glycosyltransferase family 4 protein [Mucilaginibacter pineti]SDE01143.1 Glycosyltransferase involved in cell wall bisynthesis [Mucilaginibacter pineti]